MANRKIVNEKRYKAGPTARIVEVRLKVMLDSVPGVMHQIEDAMPGLFQNPYVQSAEIVE